MCERKLFSKYKYTFLYDISKLVNMYFIISTIEHRLVHKYSKSIRIWIIGERRVIAAFEGVIS